jgi:hypothetical protein
VIYLKNDANIRWRGFLDESVVLERVVEELVYPILHNLLLSSAGSEFKVSEFRKVRKVYRVVDEIIIKKDSSFLFNLFKVEKKMFSEFKRSSNFFPEIAPHNQDTVQLVVNNSPV